MGKEKELSPAELFLKEVRAINLKYGGHLSGGILIDEKTKGKIDNSVNALIPKKKVPKGLSGIMLMHSASTAALGTPTQGNLYSVLEKLEIMCKSLNVKIPDDLRDDIAKTLLEYLKKNMEYINNDIKGSDAETNIRNAINLSLHQGDNVRDIFSNPDFKYIANSKTIKLAAIRSHSSDVEGYLRKVIANIVSINEDDSLAVLSDFPKTIVQFSYVYPNDAKKGIASAFNDVRKGVEKVNMINKDLYQRIVESDPNYVPKDPTENKAGAPYIQTKEWVGYEK